MLLAELNGKVAEGIQNSEDYLTSCVFGHLRYLPPSVFWEQFLSHAMNAPLEGESISLAKVLRQQNICIPRYSELRIHFWPKHPRFGEPDLSLVFSGGGMRPTVVFIEAKLWSEKSGTGENDQLAKYLQSIYDLPSFSPSLPSSAFVALLYLTPRESLVEVEETLAVYGRTEGREHLFRIQWQDVIVAARESRTSSSELLCELILSDVAEFLRIRGLEYFNGLSLDSTLPLVTKEEAAFYSRADTLLSMLSLPSEFKIQRGEWAK